MPEFTTDDPGLVLDFMQAHPFVTLIGYSGQHSVATQVPVLIVRRGDKLFLQGHVMRKTDHHRAFEAHDQALVLFTGPHCYVSAGWYSGRGHGSTWNYSTVHARGALRFMDDDFTIDLLRRLTHRFEDGQERPELLEAMDMQEYVRPMVKAIAGFEIAVETLIPVFKLSQNRDDESYRNIIAQLEAGTDTDGHKVAAAMRANRPSGKA